MYNTGCMKKILGIEEKRKSTIPQKYHMNHKNKFWGNFLQQFQQHITKKNTSLLPSLYSNFAEQDLEARNHSQVKNQGKDQAAIIKILSE